MIVHSLRQYLPLFVALFIVLLGAGCNPALDELATMDSEVRYQAGDNKQWAQPDWDDTSWPLSPLLALPDDPQVLWIRFDVPVQSVETLGISAAGAVAREIYWDGVLVGKAGSVGSDRASEIPGPIDAAFRIPDSLATPGTHLVAIRVSSFHRPESASGLLMNFVSGDYGTLKIAPLLSNGVPLLFLGGFVLVALYYAGLYAADQQRTPYLLTALLCLAVAGLLIAESWREAFGYTYDLHTIRINIIEGLTAAVGLLLSTTFAIQFDLTRKWQILAGLLTCIVLALLLIQDHETSAYTVFTISLIAALAITSWATWRKLSGARLALVGVIICFIALLFAGHDFMDGAFFPAFGILVAGLLTSVGLQTREERRRLAVARAAADRLETELLKKHLQPHFLMNTLTSIMEWVETDPAQGAKAMEALATEFRALVDISGERLIPMSRELALCNAHLKVMGFRQAIQFELEVVDVNVQDLIPPAVIHTLIENAITHNAYTEGNVTFTLTEKRAGNQIANLRTLELQTPIAPTNQETTKSAGVLPAKEGGGLRYIRSRLEEAAPGQWQLASNAQDGMWVTTIAFPTGGVL